MFYHLQARCLFNGFLLLRIQRIEELVLVYQDPYELNELFEFIWLRILGLYELIIFYPVFELNALLLVKLDYFIDLVITLGCILVLIKPSYNW